MRILVVRGIPRKEGHTQHITDLVVQGASEAGAHIDDIDLYTKKINRCVGCYHCWIVSPGTCVHHDDMPGIIEQLYAADIILFATPLYNYTMSSILKRFLERLFSLTRPGLVKTPSGLFRNKEWVSKKWGVKKIAVISSCAFKSMRNFNPLDETFKLIANGMNLNYLGGILRPESHLLPFTISKPKTIKIIEAALAQCGRELTSNGTLPKELLDKVATPLAKDMAHFQNYSTIYWEEVAALGNEGIDPKKVQAVIVRDVRILMHEMARCINPKTTAKLKAVLQFNFTDKNLHYCMTVNKGTCTLEEKESATFDLSITTDSATWGQLFTQELPVKDAIMEKKIVLEGDKNLFMRLGRYFPPPSS